MIAQHSERHTGTILSLPFFYFAGGGMSIVLASSLPTLVTNTDKHIVV